MVKARKHPQFEREDNHLQDTVASIDRYIEKNTPVYGHGADQKSAHAVWEIQNELLQKAKDARHNLYFGRVDWQRGEDGVREIFYIGHVSHDDTNPELRIFAWQDTLLGDLYYQMETKREDGTLLLKRTFRIQDQDLRSISDDYVDDSLDEDLSQELSDALLIDLLQQTRGGRLQSIVATIRKKQHQLITAPEDQILVVEGPPGSGKTEIALHRVSYILYQDRVSPSQRRKRILVLGPNRLFINYTSGVLPSLGERNVEQRAFDEWLYQMLDAPFDYEPQHLSLEVLLDADVPTYVKTMRYRNAVNKSSLKMARLLDIYVDLLQSEILDGKEDLVCRAVTPTAEEVGVRITPNQIRRQLAGHTVASRPFNERRGVLEDRLVRFLYRELEDRYKARTGEISERAAGQMYELITRQVHDYFESWRALNVSVAYRRLLRNPHLLREAGADIFSEWDLELLMQDAPTALTPFRFSDLPALMYLKILLDGLPGATYDHIVVDEAQDITPMQFKLLAQFCPGRNMTIMGDMKQGIFAYHGVEEWAELMDETPYNLEYIPNSYRSTMQINTYANKLLTRTGVSADQLINSVSREGPQPVEYGYETLAQWAQTARTVAGRALKHGWKSVAIIGKNLAGCRSIVQALWEAGLDDARLIENVATDELAQVVVIPLHLAKGLEFDVVILADADEETYPADTLHARLLYVAITRAAHQLYVNWVGQKTPLLADSDSPIHLTRSFAGTLEPAPETISQFARENEPLDAAWCVERLAGADKLHLLENGRIDETVISALLNPYRRNLQRTAERTVQPLDLAAREEIADSVRALRMNTQLLAGLALTQLTYGLLRNHMRFAGLVLDSDSENNLEEQVILLRTFQQFLEPDAGALLAGRWTTARVVLNLVSDIRKEQAADILNLLVDFGIVEKNGDQIRVSSDQALELLNAALGDRPGNWDPDLVALLPSAPHMLARAQTGLEVTHDRQ